MTWENYDDVINQLREAGLDVDSLEVDTPKPKRCREIGGDKANRGWYCLKTYGDFIVGAFGIYRGDDPGKQNVKIFKKCQSCNASVSMKEKTCPSCGSTKVKRKELTEGEKKAIKQQQEEAKRKAAAERKAEADHAAAWAHAVWVKCREVQPREHDYLVRKQLNHTGNARILESLDGIELPGATEKELNYLSMFVGSLVIPMCDVSTGAVRALQFILSREQHKEMINKRKGRDKEYWPKGMQKDGIAHIIGGTMHGVGLVTEGFATAISLFEATGVSTAIAFDANSVPKVGEALYKQYRKRVQLIYCADDDWIQKCKECNAYTPVAEPNCKHCGKPHGKQNAGITRAAEAALATNGQYITPQFKDPRPDDKKGPTDFNDLHCLEGLNAVRAQLEAVLPQRTGVFAAAPRRARHQGGGEDRPDAVSSLSLDEAVERFIHIDDQTGEFVFDSITKQICKFSKVTKMLPARIRIDDVKDHSIWQSRAVYIDQIGFDPTEKDPRVKCNMWNGWPTHPKEGKCRHLLDLLDYLCNGESQVMTKGGMTPAEWVLKWLAYPLQNPGAKMQTALVFHGGQGTGKNLFFECIMEIYGKYGSIVDQRAIEDKHNDYASCKLFLIADEVVARQELYHNKNNIKHLITGRTIRINPKHVAAHDESNHINIVFLSNEVQPLHLESWDRRFMVLWTPPKLDEEFYREVAKEIKDGGVEALHHHLLNLDLTGFDEHTKPIMTKAKEDLIDIGMESPERFLREWRSGDLNVPFGPCKSSELYQLYTKWCNRNGEPFVKKIQMFMAPLKKLHGWQVSVNKDYFTSMNDPSSRKKQKMVIPAMHELTVAQANNPMEINIAQHLLQPAEEGRLAYWLTEWCNVFSAAMQKEDW